MQNYDVRLIYAHENHEPGSSVTVPTTASNTIYAVRCALHKTEGNDLLPKGAAIVAIEVRPA